MTYNSSINLPFPQSSSEVTNKNNPSYRPSVPIAVYRQLAEELKISENKLKFVQEENKKLAEHNQELQKEIVSLIKQGKELQELVSKFEFNLNPPTSSEEAQIPVKVQKREIKKTPERNSPTKANHPFNLPKSPVKSQAIIEEVSVSKSQKLSSSAPMPVNGFFLGVALVFIVLTTFGVGFAIIHTALSNNNS